MEVTKPGLMKPHLIFTFLFTFSITFSVAQTCNIIDFGARDDSTFLNTRSIQSAINKCYSNGGGEVIVPSGKYYTGTVFLKSNVYLNLMPGAILQGSYNPTDYPEYNIAKAEKFGTITHNGLYIQYMKAIVIADGANHTGIKGEGVIRGAGDGKAFQLGLNKDGKPMNIFFIGCSKILLRDISVLNSAQVTISISGCDKVTIDRIFIQSLTNWNCDGLDIDAKEVTLSNCMIDSEDDALCFKSEYLNKFCENITVTNCTLSSICNGIKWGTGSRSGFRNFTIDNCVIKKGSFNGYRHFVMTPDIVYQPDSNSVNTGIVILGVDGGVVENINISNIVMTDVLTPIVIRIGRRFVTPDNKPSILRHIRIQNVIAESRTVIPCIIAGLEDSPVEDVKISNIRISIPIAIGLDSFKSFTAIIPENEKSYPENRMFGVKLPGSAFYIRHAKDVYFNDVSIIFNNEDARPVFYMDDVKGIRLKSVFINDKILVKNEAMILQKNSESIDVID